MHYCTVFYNKYAQNHHHSISWYFHFYCLCATVKSMWGDWISHCFSHWSWEVHRSYSQEAELCHKTSNLMKAIQWIINDLGFNTCISDQKSTLFRISSFWTNSAILNIVISFEISSSLVLEDTSCKIYIKIPLLWMLQLATSQDLDFALLSLFPHHWSHFFCIWITLLTIHPCTDSGQWELPNPSTGIASQTVAFKEVGSSSA